MGRSLKRDKKTFCVFRSFCCYINVNNRYYNKRICFFFLFSNNAKYVRIYAKNSRQNNAAFDFVLQVKFMEHCLPATTTKTITIIIFRAYALRRSVECLFTNFFVHFFVVLNSFFLNILCKVQSLCLSGRGIYNTRTF